MTRVCRCLCKLRNIPQHIYDELVLQGHIIQEQTTRDPGSEQWLAINHAAQPPIAVRLADSHSSSEGDHTSKPCAETKGHEAKPGDHKTEPCTESKATKGTESRDRASDGDHEPQPCVESTNICRSSPAVRPVAVEEIGDHEAKPCAETEACMVLLYSVI